MTLQELKDSLKIEGMEVTIEPFSVPGFPNMEVADNLYVRKEGVEIRIELHEGRALTKGAGHTSFDTSKGRRTFDSRGVSDSFYIDEDDTVQTIQAQIEEELVRIKEAKDRVENAVVVPGFQGQFLMLEADRVKAREALKKGRSHYLTPGGMGTGYRLYTGWMQRFDRKAPEETCVFFEVPSLNMASVDCD